MKRLLWAIVLCLPTLASAQGQHQPPFPGAYEDEHRPLEQLHSIPYTYVGGSGRLSLTMDNEGNSTGELLRIFDNTGEHAWIGQLWWGHGGAGGIQVGYNWLWGGMTLSQAKEDPARVTVARTLFAVDQNMHKDRKMTLGLGFERPSYFLDAYLSAAASSSRNGGQRLDALQNLLAGTDDIGSYNQLETITTLEEFATAAYDYGIGLRFGRNSLRHGLRMYGGLDYQDGDDGAHILTLSAGADKHLGRRGWSLSGLVEHDQSSTDPLLGTSSDTRATLALRYEFGGRIFVPSSEAVAPAWISRAMASPPTSRPRVVQTYTRRTKATTTTELAPKEYTNYHPIGVDDVVSVEQGSTGLWIDVLANDSDADGDVLSLDSVTSPAHGTATVSGNRVHYVPSAGFIGSDQFSYTISDGRGSTGGATVYITVTGRPNQEPIAQDDHATTPVNTPVTLSPAANDIDPDDDPLTVTRITQPANGSATLNNGQVTYTPRSGFTGVDSFTYTIEDGRGGSATGTITITVLSPDNRAPIANDDHVILDASSSASVTMDIHVLGNDEDPDGDSLEVIEVSQGAHGSVSILGGGNVRYVWTNPGASAGGDQFTYTISDGRGGIATATVYLTLMTTTNRPPVANPDAVDVYFDDPAEILVQANDIDPDGDVLRVVAVTPGSRGNVVSIQSGGDYVRYVWTNTNTQPGTTDQFSYTISDGHGGTAMAEVTVTLRARSTNLDPIAVDDLGVNDQGVEVYPGVVTPIYVLANDYDPDGGLLQVTSVSGNPSNSVTILGGGTHVGFAWMDTSATVGSTDEFTYTISDGQGGTAMATVRVRLGTPFTNNPPIAVPHNAGAVLFNDTTVPLDVLVGSDDPDGDVLTLVAVTNGMYGTAGPAPGLPNHVIYTWTAPVPSGAFQPGAMPTDTFTYTLSDGNGGFVTENVTVSRLNRAPTTNFVRLIVDSALPMDMLIDVANDSTYSFDMDEDELTITGLTGAPTTWGFNIVGNMVHVTGAPIFSDELSFTYTIIDGRGGVASGTVEIAPF